MITATTIAGVRAVCDDTRARGGTVGLVPTMGFFHEGHRSLMRAARAAHDVVVVSLFVNPTQFGPNEDLDAYPRDLDADTAVAVAEGVDVLFTPDVAEMYPDGSCTTVHVDKLTTGLCGAARPGHFDGVTTVVTKLFSIVAPCTAYFGRKDAQQLAVVRRMTRDLDLRVEIVGCPLVRESDGLAMSSRNSYLSAAERPRATVLVRALRGAADAVASGERDASAIRDVLASTFATEPAVRVDYAAIVDADTLQPLQRLEGDTLIALAAHVGRTRLIDNIAITFHDGAPTFDFGLVVSGTTEEDRCTGS